MFSKYKFLPEAETGFLSEQNTKKYFSRFGFSVFGCCLAIEASAFLLSTLFSFLVQSLFPWMKENATAMGIVNNLFSLICIYAVGLPVFLWISSPLPRLTPIKEKMKPAAMLGSFCVAVLLMNVGNYISNVIIINLEALLDTTTQNPVSEAINSTTVWVTVAFTVIIAPLLEEIFFRKIVCDKLLPLGEGYAILISAVVFGLIHGNLYQFAYAFLLGALFGFIYVKTGKLIYSIVLHSAINLMGSVIAPAIFKMIDLEELEHMLSTGTVDPNSPIMQPLAILGGYEMLIIAVSAVGISLLVKAKKRGDLALDAGILPPPKEGRVANVLCTVGIAASITYFVFAFLVSLL